MSLFAGRKTLIDISASENGITFGVKVLPRSSRAGVAGEIGGLLKVKVSAAPVDGAANAELVKTLSRHFKVSAASVRILRGETGRTKTVEILGIDAGAARYFLNDL